MFNIGSAYLADGEQPQPRRDLVRAMMELAQRELGRRPPRGMARRRWPSVAEVQQLLDKTGYGTVETHVLRYETTMADVHEWLSVPIFTERPFAGVPFQVRKGLLDRAYQDVDPDETDQLEWIAFVATAPDVAGAA